MFRTPEVPTIWYLHVCSNPARNGLTPYNGQPGLLNTRWWMTGACGICYHRKLYREEFKSAAERTPWARGLNSAYSIIRMHALIEFQPGWFKTTVQNLKVICKLWHTNMALEKLEITPCLHENCGMGCCGMLHSRQCFSSMFLTNMMYQCVLSVIVFVGENRSHSSIGSC